MDIRKNTGIAWLEVIAIVLMVFVLIVVVWPARFMYLSLNPHRAVTASCQNNLKQWALVFKMYANESRGEYYPPIQQPLDEDMPRLVFAPNLRDVYPEYLTDPAISVCPASPFVNVDDLKNEIGRYAVHLSRAEGGKAEYIDDSYVYWGWCLDEIGDGNAEVALGEELAAYAGIAEGDVVPLQVQGAIQETFDAYVKNNSARTVADFNYPAAQALTAGDVEPKRVLRLREGLERFLLSDTNNVEDVRKMKAGIPIMHDLIYLPHGGTVPMDNGHKFDSRKPTIGTHVVFMDGHVEFLEYGTPEFSSLFSDAYLRSLVGAHSN